MPYSIQTSQFNFLQFGELDSMDLCNWPGEEMCLPVYSEDDVWFQFVVVADTEEEADALCNQDNAMVRVGIIQQCTDALAPYAQLPTRYRISPTQVLYGWQHGLPGITQDVEIGNCFRIGILVSEQFFCSNCFQRIGNDCYTQVLQYSNDENAFGFNYCSGGSADEGGDVDCDPIIIQFNNQATMTIPWTAFLQAKYGSSPQVQVWVNDGGELVVAGIRVAMDAFPPTELRFDFGGVSTGIIKIS